MRDQQIEQFEACLSELLHMVDMPQFSGRAGDGGFYAWECLQRLVGELQTACDRFELEGDAAPARLAVERYLALIGHLPVRPEARLVQLLNELLTILEADLGTWHVGVSTQLLNPEQRWPSHYLKISPEGLKRHLRQRAH